MSRKHKTKAGALLKPVRSSQAAGAELRAEPLPYRVWGAQGIDPAALDQMNNSMRLPVAVTGALMPDAHVGYGLPIGGVLATEGAVIPYAVGVDIACRMRLSVFEVSPIVLAQQKERFEKALMNNTRFGAGVEWKSPQEDEVLDDANWQTTPLLRSLHDKAIRQLGTSGSGNHFADLGEFSLEQDDAQLGLPAGKYLALLTHSGSRGVGFKIADAYSGIARAMHPELDKGMAHLGWLNIDSEAGQEYWLSMELAGRFAAANHRVIHWRIAKALGLKAAAVVENHHNFAWRERLADGREVIVHRKGATPAALGVLGVIPGSMGDPGYVVRGLGNPQGLNSAAHGAGRQMSRTRALESITKTMRDAYLREKGVTLLGGGLDESPQAYKPINEVIAAQSDLVEIVGRFRPRIVMMTDDPRDI
ncbi:MAG: RtcB family protein [Chloroflexi bacterium]|nr:RtcB family protein [Chloroflexota bacterium]MCL5274088.1 RtcB family protein [Chloroflexota bacterium]